ncbi:pyruvate:ferredoxin (flavodoxin) oxidoreductase [Megasphaera cerevisiae]|uniref:pyruvate:ferredoxin (flavodoxin) oxidoreductase n=1 Tax=Megasphaera cerevisiae TaxID=39029 RepID=UPI000942D020|nr:pyruvate:ferredoxin (flavodoxin) oxidoreductase [Megasphaera cerevisiae]OKY52709.1 pyruvate:ferredoxin (flavodoxin) oxidoreductase [Megasphaera cerevisiae]
MSKYKKRFKTMDGNTAAAHVAYAFTEVATIYPITPSSPMAEQVDEWAAHGRKNLFGHTVKVSEMQSEGGAAGAMHGALAAGALTTTFTASQGLMLMLPELFKIAGELLPGVFHVASRTVASNALSIMGENNDVMTTRTSGVAMLAESSVQEIMDLSAVAHGAAISSRIPFINFFDGFRTSHEIQKIEVLEEEDLKQFLDPDAVQAFRDRSLNPDKPVLRGAVDSAEIYMQHRESINKFYEKVPDIVEGYMRKITAITGREYHLFNYTGAPDAEFVVVALGSGAETTEEVVKYLAAQGQKVGCINVHLFRPWSEKHFLAMLPETVKRIGVLERTKEPGSNGEPLYQSVTATFATIKDAPEIYGGRYGLGSKDILPADIVACFDNLQADKPKKNFTLCITDDVCLSSLPRTSTIYVGGKNLKSCKFWGFGSDGTVGANKSAIKIIGDNTDMYAQAYFAYDSKKSGGVTISHLRFGSSPIKMPYLIHTADFIACHRQSYVHQFELLQGIKPGGIFLLNCTWTPDELEEKLPASLKRVIAENKVQFYIINGVEIGRKIGLGSRINMIMQAAFFKLANIIPLDLAITKLKESVMTAYGKKGQKIVDMNNAAIDQGIQAIVKIDVPKEWKIAQDVPVPEAAYSEYYKKFADPMNCMLGDTLPVSAFDGREDGTYPTGTAKEEKRGVAIFVPSWDSDACIQCNQCAFVCPHAAIRPFLMTPAEAEQAPAGIAVTDAAGVADMKYSIITSVMDCLGCGSCTYVCPKQALTMQPFDDEEYKAPLWDYSIHLPKKSNPMKKTTVKGSQFEQPLCEFTGACAGCGETPYAKLLTQLYGDRMMIANSHGCSHVWAASAPGIGYAVNEKGHGPSWADSLFEDAAEYGYGMFLGVRSGRELLKGYVAEAMAAASPALQSVLQDWQDHMMVSEGTRERADAVVALLEKEKKGISILEEVYRQRQYLVKRSHWIFGGDGWSYDIGYGGLDHVLSQNQDINVFVCDTEVYSNTGGQASKATPTAAVAQFAAAGKRNKKKDLGMMAMTYGYVYVAQVAMGADKNQLLKAITEAEAYPGPSLIIGYSPCISHGLKAGQGQSQLEEKRAVECGYWNLYRYNPELRKKGQNPFTLDSAKPTANFREFLMGEVRYSSLKKTFPEIAEALFADTEHDARERYESYVRLQKSLDLEYNTTADPLMV